MNVIILSCQDGINLHADPYLNPAAPAKQSPQFRLIMRFPDNFKVLVARYLPLVRVL